MAGKITGADILNNYYNSRKSSSSSKDEKEEKKKAVTAADILKGAENIRKYNNTDTSGVDQKYIDTFFTDANNYLSSAEKDFESVGWGNASSSFDSRNAAWSDLSARADTINAWLYKNRSNMKEEDYSNLYKTLDDFRTSGSSVLDSFGSARDYYAQWESEDAYNNWYAEEQRKEEEKKAITGAADFEEYFNKGNEYGEAPSFLDKLTGNTQYNSVAYMRNDPEALKLYEDSAESANGGSWGTAERQLTNQIEYKAAKWMTDDEFKVYNYYYAKDMENGTDTARQFLNSIEETLNLRAADEKFATLQGNTLAEIFYGFAAGADQFEQGIINLGNMVTGDTSLTSPTQITAGMVREDLADNGPEIFGSSLGQIGYDMTSTTANMLPSVLAGAFSGSGLAGSLTLGASATGNAYNEMRNLGYDRGQATAYGALVGASETALSYFLGGISKLGGGSEGIFQSVAGKIVPHLDNALAKVAITLGGNMIDEGLEEAIQEVLDPVFKMIATGEDFEGIDLENVLYSGLLGALSAGVMDGAPTIAGKVASDIQTSKRYSGKLDTSLQKAFGIKPTKADNQLVQKQMQQDLVTKSLEINPESTYAQKMQGRLDKGKTLSGNQLNSIIEANERTLVAQDKDKIKSATEARLAEYGEAGDAARIAEVITKKITGETISKAEQKILDGSKYAEVVMAELDPNNPEARVSSSGWMENIGTERISPEAYNKGTKTASSASSDTSTEKAAEPTFKTAESGKTTLDTTGEEITIKEIASVKDGEIALRLENGETVSAKNVEFGSSKEGLLYENVVHMGFNPATANAFIKGFNPSEGLSADVYANGFKEAYRYGTYGIPMHEMSQNGFSAELSEAQRTLAYNLGKTDAKYKLASKQAKTTSTVTVNADKSAEKGASKARKGKLHNTLKPTSERQRASLKALGVVAEALGIDIYTFESEVVDGKRKGANGWYNKKDNSIHIDLYAGRSGESTMLFTASHELTHFIREWSPDKFKTFADFLFEQYGEKGVSVDELIKKQIAKAAKKDRVISYDTAYEEVVADACEMMLTDSNAIEKIAELKAKDKSLWEKIKEFITGLVARIKAAYEGLDPDSEEANLVREMKDAAEKLQALWTEALMDAGKANLESDLVEMDASTESVAPAFSERTWTGSDYVLHRDEMAEKIAKALDVSIEKAKGYIDDINSIAKMIANDRVRLDYEASSFGSAFVSNVEYGGSFDYTTLCKKRRIYTGTFTEIQKRLKDVALTPDDILKIRNLMIEEGIEATCGLCYVEGSRANMGKFAKEFIRLYKRDNPDAWIPNMADVNTPDGVEQMRISHPEAYEQYEYFWNHYGKLKDSDPALFASQQKPKLYEARKEYKGEILEHFSKDTSVQKKNLNGGIRMQSFSDFEIVHLIDTMQVIMDMSTVGLAGQAYTKVPEFAEAFGNTGLKINLSLIAKGVDADGKLIFDDREGMPHETAFDLRNRYSKNVGTIIVTFTDEQLLAAMADPRIDYIIPFHRSQWKKGQYGAMGLPKGTKDYTYMQNEKLIKKTYHEYRGRMVADKATNYMPNEYWDFTKSGKENAEAYLKMCAENNKRPKFYKLLDYDGNGTYSLKADGSTDGYWKLLIDFKMYDNDGAGSPQMAVTPTFTMDKAMKMLDEYKGGHSKYPVASSVVDTFVEQYNEEHGVMYSERDSYLDDYSYEALVSKPDMQITALDKVPEAESEKYKRNKDLFAKNMRSIVAKSDNKKNTSTSTYLYCRDLGEDVLITKDSFKHGAARMDAAYIAVCKNISNILNNSVVVNELEKRDETNGAYILLGLAEAEDSYVVVRSVVHKKTWKLEDYNELYAIKKKSIETKKEDVGFKPPNYTQKSGFGTSSTISIADFITLVNGQNLASSVFSLDVVKKLGSSRGFDENVTPYLMYSERDTDSMSTRSLLAGALESVAQNDIEKQKLADYKKKIDLIAAEEAKFTELRAKIKELSFAKGARDTEAIKKLRLEAKQTENRINIYDRQLLSLEATAPLKAVLEREKALARKRGKQEGREALEAYKERADKTQRELMERYAESRKKASESRNKTAMRHRIKSVVDELNQYLLKGTKSKHVPIELQKAVAEALDAVNMDTVTAEERIAEKRAEMLRAKTPEKMERIAKEIETIREMGGNMAKKISRLKAAYDSIINSDDPLIAGSHDDVISSTIDKVLEVVGDTPLRDMSLYQLEAVYDMYRMVLHSIRAANKAFKAKKSEEISVIANRVLEEMDGLKKKKKLQSKAGQAIAEFDWNNQKPIYAFERIGSNTFTEVFENVRAGEDTWAADMSDAQAFREEQYKKHGYAKWDFGKKHKFTSATGNDFELTLGQIMSLYAYSKRGDQAIGHLRKGGFVFDGLTEVKEKTKLGTTKTLQFKDATAYNLSEETLGEIISKLTPEQTAFVDKMQTYLSDVMGEKGNEVSLELYGIKLFKEKNYFPLKSDKRYLARAREQASGDPKIKNKGFTKETNSEASNPIVLTPFMDVWAEHVNEMSMYHAFTLAMEDFYRVYGYKTPAADNMESVSVVSFLENAHGEAATKYIDQLLKDLNGGARSDAREGIAKTMMSNFKKASVMASLSVVIQQPSAIVRAQALVDAKHFIGKKVSKAKHKELWAEVKKYAPVAIIKEMGYFDVGMGQGSAEWLKGEKTWKDKADDILSWAPAKADEYTWCAIWQAVKRETLRKNPKLAPTSEEFLTRAGERFTEVIAKTQVYDSTLSRSANMRSKSAFMNMLTAFMAEPTTSINMLQEAFGKGKGFKHKARVMGAVYGSVLLNSALVSIIYAMRDDDEDETFAEKYLSRLTTEIIDGVNPLTYIPFVKDIWSAAQGFDVERADMTLITSLFDSMQALIKVAGKDTTDMEDEEKEEHSKDVTEAILSIVDNISSLTGIPVKNVRRDIKGIINGITTIMTDAEGRPTTGASLGDAILGEVQSSIPVWGWLPGKSKADKVYGAIDKGDTAYTDRLKDTYKDEKAFNTNFANYIRKMYEDDNITAEKAKEMLASHGGKTEEEAQSKVQEWEFKKKYPDYDLSASEIERYYSVAEPAYISADVYYDYCTRKASAKGTDLDGDGKTDSGSKKAEVMQIIHSLPLSREQKNALYFANGWAASTIFEAPWY
jgi:hypothetical protein